MDDILIEADPALTEGETSLHDMIRAGRVKPSTGRSAPPRPPAGVVPVASGGNGHPRRQPWSEPIIDHDPLPEPEARSVPPHLFDALMADLEELERYVNLGQGVLAADHARVRFAASELAGTIRHIEREIARSPAMPLAQRHNLWSLATEAHQRASAALTLLHQRDLHQIRRPTVTRASPTPQKPTFAREFLDGFTGGLVGSDTRRLKG